MRPRMGPEYGTPEYKAQVEQIKNIMRPVADLGQEAIERVMFWFIMDKDYSRAAICQAENEIKRELA